MVETLIDLPDSTVKAFQCEAGGSLFSEVLLVLETIHGLLFAQRQTHHHRRSHPSRKQQLLGQLLKKDKKATEECAVGMIEAVLGITFHLKGLFCCEPIATAQGAKILCTCKDTTAVTSQLICGALPHRFLANPELLTLVIKPLAFVPISIGVLENSVASCSIIGPLASLVKRFP